MLKKQTVKKNQKSIEETLWDSADKLRGSVESSEYKHVVLALIFLKFASDCFEHRRAELIEEGKEKYIDMVEFYTMKNVFFLPEESRWTYLIKNAKQNDIAVKIDTALHTAEKTNKALQGALPDNYFSRLNLDVSKLAALLDTINNIHTLKDKEQDIIGRIYEYFLRKFAIKEGKGKGEFYTPKSIVNLIAEIIEPYQGIIYDPCCGSGGMFVQSMKFVESHQGNTKNISIYGQEATSTTYKLGKMNLAIRGISCNLGDVAADTFSRDQHPDLKADYIMANPPFNLKDWRAADELTNDHRWSGYDVPPVSNANYGWEALSKTELPKTLGDYVQPIDVRNRNLIVVLQRGISTEKKLIETKANMTGVSTANYKIVGNRQFVYTADTSRRGDKMALAFNSNEPCIVSSIYTVFEVAEGNGLLPEYLFLWFKRSEFDRYSRFHSWGSARETFDWADMCVVRLPIPSIEIQESIVAIHHTLETRKRLNIQLKSQIQKLCPILMRGVIENMA